SLSQSPLLAPLARIAAAHHERLDGSGYHRGVPGSMLPLPARVLAAADVYRALTEPRPHRPAIEERAAADELQQCARRGTLDREAVRAVCEAAGHRVKKRGSGWPASLSDREVEVLRHLARGRSEKNIAALLFIRLARCTRTSFTCTRRSAPPRAPPRRCSRWSTPCCGPKRKYTVQ